MDKNSSKIYDEKEIVLAIFDILGSSKRIMDNQYKIMYDFYTHMMQLCSDEKIPLSIPGVLPHERGKEIVLSFPMKHAFFSDTFILWVEYDEFYNFRLGGFYEKCIDIFIEALKKNIPLRGVISRGAAIMDESNKIYLGKPIVEAAKAETSQEWLGVALAPSYERFFPTEAQYLLPYIKHKKNERKDTLSDLVLDWPRYWREAEKESPVLLIKEMNTDEKFSSYYDNTIEFVSYSSDKSEFMRPIEEKAPPLYPFIVIDSN